MRQKITEPLAQSDDLVQVGARIPRETKEKFKAVCDKQGLVYSKAVAKAMEYYITPRIELVAKTEETV